MNIDNDAAALLAQVIPALLVFAALEDRLTPTKIPNQKWRARVTGWRERAVVFNLLALGLCLAIVVTDIETTALRNLITPAIVMSVAFLLLVLAFLFLGMFIGEETQPENAADSVN